MIINQKNKKTTFQLLKTAELRTSIKNYSEKNKIKDTKETNLIGIRRGNMKAGRTQISEEVFKDANLFF